jgi:Zn-dependent metalloprotease
VSRYALHCILPPYILERLAESDVPQLRRLAIETIEQSAYLRAQRATLAQLPAMAATPSPARRKHRLIYDAESRGPEALPGRLVRSEGEPRIDDPAANEAYAHSGTTYDFYRKVFGRNSLDDAGMALISSVHLGRRYNNAFWNGEQMAYGDGDGRNFLRFTRSLDVVGHELSHGVVDHTSGLEYRGEPGALNEHFADVFGALVKQWKRKQGAAEADWRIGAEILGRGTRARALRTFKDEPAFRDDPLLGDDPQPKHLRDKYTGSADAGGVHINSGIPNHAFYRAALALGGAAWERAGRIWYETLGTLHWRSDFAAMAERTVRSAGALHGAGSREERVVAQAWKDVGL